MAQRDEFAGDGTAPGDSILDGIGDDIAVLDAVDLPIILITRDCRIARINRAATTVLGLNAADVGRTLSDSLPGVEDISKLCARVMADGAPHRIETRHRDKSFLLRIAPYSGKDRRALGSVLAFTNVTAFRASIDQAIYEREYTKAILNAVVDPLVVLDDKLQVQTANRAFYSLFGVSRDETQNISIRKLGNDEWATSRAWASVEASLSNHTQAQAIEIEGELPVIGRRTFVLDAHGLARDRSALILLTLHDITERKQAERTTSLLAAIVDSSDDAILSKKLDGTITSWNKSAERLFGYTPEEAIGQHITLIVPWERRSEEEGILRRLAEGERVDHFETVRRRKDGSTLEVSLTISPIRDAVGRVIGASNVARDITERKRIEQALQQSEKKYREFAETASIALHWVSSDGTIIWANQAELEMLGYCSDEYIGHNISEFHADAPVLEDILNRLFRGDRIKEYEARLRAKDGSLRQVIIDSSALFEGGKFVHTRCFTRDISERKQAEELLRRSEERFRALVNASSDVVYHMSPDWSEMRQLDGKGFIADTGKPRKDWLNEYIDVADQPLVLKAIREAVRTKSLFELEHRVRRADGTLGWTYSRAVPLLDANGAILEWFGAATDVTARREAEEKYRQLAQTLDAEVRARTRELEEQSNQVRELSWRLLRSQDEERRHIARELHDSAGQTLTVLGINLAQLAQKVGRNAPEVATEAEQIQETVQQLHREIRTTSYLLHPPLLDESGLYSAIDWYVQGLQERSGLELRFDCSEKFGRLAREMELVIFRLVQECLTNIHRHSASKAASIQLSRESNQITLEIRDQGKGMSRERLTEIQSGRSGVGITGMRERLRQFAGTLAIESGDSGTRVFATIPVPKASSSEDDTKPEPLQAAIL
jgi:PAS domain S-box-containing protein